MYGGLLARNALRRVAPIAATTVGFLGFTGTDAKVAPTPTPMYKCIAVQQQQVEPLDDAPILVHQGPIDMLSKTIGITSLALTGAFDVLYVSATSCTLAPTVKVSHCMANPEDFLNDFDNENQQHAQKIGDPTVARFYGNHYRGQQLEDMTTHLTNQGKTIQKLSDRRVQRSKNAAREQRAQVEEQRSRISCRYQTTRLNRLEHLLDGAEVAEQRRQNNQGRPESNQRAHEIVYGHEGTQIFGDVAPTTGGTTNGGATQGAAPGAGQPLPPQLPGEVFRSTFNKHVTKDDNDNDVIDLTHTKSNFGCTATSPAG
jgi:hypothetical protein